MDDDFGGRIMELKETGKRNKLFISHCSEIDQTASEIAEYFEAEGISVEPEIAGQSGSFTDYRINRS